MKSSLLAVLTAGTLALSVSAQEDRISLNNGTVIDGVRVTSFDVRELKYSKGGSSESVSSDRVAKLELGKFSDVYRRALGNRDPDLLLTMAREQVKAKNDLLGMAGLHRAGTMFLDQGKAAEGVSALEEMQKAYPEGGLVPEVFRQKFEYYLGQGAKGAGNAGKVAKAYVDTAQGNAWPSGFSLEGDFFGAMAERMAGGDPKEYQSKLRAISSNAATNSPTIANRASVQLAHSLRETKDADGARKIYEDLASKNGVDVNSRAGAYLGLGLLLLDEGVANKEANRAALLMFLRVRLETRDAWPSLQAEALYNAILAADKWRGNEYGYIMARCRGVLFNEFGSTEWAQRAKQGR
ncbi:MAG: hypothetical protein H6838_04040 [Planctomycetes bacterium]|nr:hypothetical protein [Planctomycetota bacterium]MCB9884637.1 hypothetical protein [Planctomycetota bacterium]